MLEVLVTHDSKVNAYSAPILFPNLALGLEYFTQFIASNEASEINVSEYDLFHIGTYDRQTAKFELFDKPKHLHNFAALKQPVKETK